MKIKRVKEWIEDGEEASEQTRPLIIEIIVISGFFLWPEGYLARSADVKVGHKRRWREEEDCTRYGFVVGGCFLWFYF